MDPQEQRRRLECAERIGRFQDGLRKAGIEAALIVNGADMYYFTGTAQSAHLFIPAAGTPLLMVKREFSRARMDAAIEDVVPIRSFKEIPALITDHGHALPACIGLEFDVLPVSTYLYYHRLFPNTQMVDCWPIIRRLRMIKSDFELDILAEAGRRMDAAFSAIPGLLEEGATEVALAGRFEAAARAQGHQGMVRWRGADVGVWWGGLLTGVNATVPGFFDGVCAGPGLDQSFGFGPSFKRLLAGEPVMVDYAGVFGGYTVDCTRIFVIGEMPSEMERAHDVALSIQNAIIRECVPGVPLGRLYELARRMADEAGLGRHFMGHEHQVRFVGHGVGLELNEMPVVAEGVESTLEAGMVLALEPKFVFPGQGLVGIENTVAITGQGVRRFTNYPDAICRL
ncbi:MAG: Xaa-Pro peptidase family protein [Eubacteriales bacterium]|jgi:Xaa-Pro aminopeptidase|nr:Xaa-Pro peptidase family protein [Bacillota bacterium]MBV1727226.1 Xaa-Pro peptidase family protein [Desulforudis sp.]MDP3050572.1 Xaa-Pro peptidase family protein [Eubacteriales bacterium]MDQ7788508.1 Xaa-Pro peptidase family protein [Clostridia bacterium]MBU4532099.1 Xaa-Pro peptidase family protein [Bacillota bacterium]